jgi:hypothetical protein
VKHLRKLPESLQRGERAISASRRHCYLTGLALKNGHMAAEIPVGVRSIVQHAVLGELAVELKQVRERPYYPKTPWEIIYPKAAKEGPEIDVLEGEISGSIQADGAAVPFVLVPRLVATADLPTWVDQCASSLMGTIANLDAIKAHVAKRRPEWIPMEPISDLEFVSHLRLTELSAYSDGSVSVSFRFHYHNNYDDGDQVAGLTAGIEPDGRLDDEVHIAV